MEDDFIEDDFDDDEEEFYWESPSEYIDWDLDW